MLRKIFNSLFFATWLAVTFAAGLVWLDHFRGYVAETEILMVEKGDAVNAGESLVNLVGTLNFYQSVLNRNENLEDPFVGDAPDARKHGWQDMTSITRRDESGVYTLTTTASEQGVALLFARETVGALFDTASHYYDVTTEIDVRIVDGPIVHTAIRHLPLFLFASIITGFAVSFAFFFLLHVLDGMTGEKKKKREASYQDYEEKEMHISADTFRPSKPTNWSMSTNASLPADLSEEIPVPKKEIKLDRKVEIPAPKAVSVPTVPPTSLPKPETPKPPVAAVTAKAPANLPILENEDERALLGMPVRQVRPVPLEAQAFSSFSGTPKPKIGTERIETTTPRIEEPSQEEFKKRLNDLLSGKMK